MAQKTNVVEKMVGWIPGYKGYAQREARRDSDRLLREGIARSLDAPRQAVDAAIADSSRAMKFEHLESLESLRRRLTAMVDRIRHAPRGYSGFFDTMKIDAATLDAIHDHDNSIRDVAKGVAASGAALATPSAESIKAASASIDQLDAAIRRRDEMLIGEW
ncbi:MAG: hypothetical protein U0575_00660 [Phycisphaerales bacterium]